MTRWFFLFILALTLIISFRVVTFSSAPINTVACDSVSIESDLSGIWDLNSMPKNRNDDEFKNNIKIFRENGCPIKFIPSESS